MKVRLLFLFLYLTISGKLLSQQKDRPVVYDDWPTTVPSNSSKNDSTEDFTTNFVPIGTTWDHRIITYFVQNGTNDILGDDEKEAIRQGFDLWALETDLYFMEVCAVEDADITILWGSFNHGDSQAFDGAGGNLAHTLGGPPPNNHGTAAGDFHFDDSETWTLASRNSNQQPIDLITVAAHEIGHSLGLDHTQVAGSLMLAHYTGSHRFLGYDDLAGIHSLYGWPGENSPIIGPLSICTSESYSISNLPNGVTINWSATGSIYISGSSTSSTVTVYSSGSPGNGILTATVSSGCGTTSISRNIKTDVPAISADDYSYNGNSYPIQEYFSIPNNVVCDLQSTVFANFQVSGATSISTQILYTSDPYITWGEATGADYTELNFYFWDYGQEIAFRITATSTCGSDQFDVAFRSEECYNQYQYAVSPNPASEEIVIEAKSRNNSGFRSEEAEINPFFARIYNAKKMVLSAQSNSNSKIIFNTCDLPNGTYFLHIIEGDEIIKRQILINH